MASRTLGVGMDGAQAPLDVAVRPTAETWPVGHAAVGLNALVAQWATMAPALGGRAATGGFAGPVLAAWAVAAVPVVRAHPRQVRALAQAIGLLAKTDRLDARGLAHCAAAVTPGPRALLEAATPELRAVLLRRRPVVAMLTAERQRLGTVPARLPHAMQQPRAWLAGPRPSLDDDVTPLSQRRAVGQATEAVLPSMPGVGPVRSRPLLAQVPA